MTDSNKKNFIDVDFDDVIDKQINGEPLYYSTNQVADILGVADSKVRYYSKLFEDVLQIEFSNRNRRYKKSDIEKLKFIIELKEEGLTLNQIKEYISEKKVEDVKKDMIIKDNPLEIQVFMKALTEELIGEVNNTLDTFKTNLLQEIKEQQQVIREDREKINEKLQETIAVTIDELVTEKLDSSLKEFKSYLDTKEQQATKRDVDMMNTLKQHMEERKEQQLQLEQEKKKSLWNRIFGK